MVKKAFLLCFLLSAAYAQADADTDRGDFFVGFGLGIGPVDMDVSSNDGNVSVYERPVVMTSFKLGGMFAPQHAVYYQYRLGFARVSRSDWDDDYQGVTVFSGLGYSYFLEPTVGSAYIEAAMGVNRQDFSGDLTGGDFEGFSYLLGAGNEFNRHLQMGAVLEVGDSYNFFTEERLFIKTLTFQLEYKF